MLKRIARGLMWVTLLVLGLLVCTLTTCRYEAHRRERIPAVLAAPVTGQLVDAGDTRIFVQEMGSADAPAALFVHGTGAWSGLWQHTLERTAAAGFHVIAI